MSLKMETCVHRKIFTLLAVSLIAVFAFIKPAGAAIFNVSNTADNLNPGTLRTAITSLNIGLANGEIDFAAGAAGTIALGSDLPTLNFETIFNTSNFDITLTGHNGGTSAGSWFKFDGAGTGTFTFGAGTAWTIGGGLVVGDNANGSMTISGGGDVSNASTSYVGGNGGSSGAVTVTGAGSTWVNTVDTFIGSGSTGTLTISAGGLVSDTYGNIGGFAGGNGTVTVTGAGSQWNNTNDIFVGKNDDGVLNIQNGGVVNDVQGFVASEVGSTGTVNVDGANSKWTNTGGLTVGRNAPGQLHITGGGAVSNTYVDLAYNDTGIATVDGAGSTWDSDGDFNVGKADIATLDVTNGGDVISNFGYIGRDATADGTATIDGAGSTWTNDFGLTVGDSGIGELHITNGGSVTVAGGAGTTTIANIGGSTGTLFIGAAGAAGTLNAAEVTGGLGTATLAFNHTNAAYTFSPLISGSLSVEQDGSGTTAPTAANTYTGVTTLNAGTLSIATISNGGTASNLGAATSAAANLVFAGGTLKYTGVDAATDRNFTITANKAAVIEVTVNTLTMNGASTGVTNGGLTKTGNGILVLAGASAYTGPTAINAGRLAARNANALGNGSAVTVANGATLDVGTTNVTVNNTYTQVTGSTLALTVSGPSSSGKITSDHAAVVSAGSNVNVTVPGSIYVPNNATFTVIDAAAGAGVNAPGTITSSDPRLTFSAISSNGSLILMVNRSATGFSSIATNSNSAAVGTVLDNISNPSADMTTVLNMLEGLSASQAASALDTVVPTMDSGVVTTSTTSLNGFTGVTIERLGELFAQARDAETGVSTGSEGPKGIEAWGRGFGEYVHQSPRGTSNGYFATVWGTAIGGDIPVWNDRVRLGLSGGYARSNINSKDNSGRTDINSYQGTLYGGYIDGNNPYYINGAFSFVYNQYDGLRNISVGTIQRTADADYDGQQYSILLDGGYTFKAGDLRITPLASLQYLHLHLQSYTESGANALNLNVRSQDYDMLQSGVGLKLEQSFEVEYGILTPEIHAKWLYDFIGDKQETTSTFSGGGGSFATQGFKPAQNALNAGAKLTYNIKDNWSIDANYDFEYKEDFVAHTGWIDLGYRF